MDWVIKLKKNMVDNGVNIEQLKTKIEQSGNSLSRNSISNILNERNSPKIETIQLITNALGIELWELFSTSESNILEKEMFGFLEYQGHIYSIKSKKDLEQFIDGTNVLVPPKVSSSKSEPPIPKFVEKPPVKTIVKRTRGPRKSVKLTRHVFRKFNVTVCDKRELFEIPNDLKRDTKIWVFRSKEDAQKAKIELKKISNIKFNE